MSNDYSQLAQAIINRQASLIGSVAWEQASVVSGLQIHDEVVLVQSPNPKAAINELVERFSNIFGPAAVEVSKDAATPFIARFSADQIPDLLK